MVAYLESLQAVVISRESHDGNNYGCWRSRMPELLASFLSRQ